MNKLKSHVLNIYAASSNFLRLKASTSNDCALIGQKEQLDLEFRAEFRCKVALVCGFLLQNPQYMYTQGTAATF